MRGRLPRAAIVGAGWRTPLGNDIAATVDRVLAHDEAVAPLTRFPAHTFELQHAAVVPTEPARSKHARFLRRMALHAIDAAGVALAAAAKLDVVPGPRMGLYAAVGGLRAHWDDIMPALVGQDDDGADAWARGLGKIHPFWMLRHLSNNTHALLATDTGARGDGATFGGGNAGAQALAAAIRALAAGAVDSALVIAYDTLLEPETLVELGARPSEPDAPDEADVVPGEAAAAIVLVADDDPRAAGAPRLSAVTGADDSRGLPRLHTFGITGARLYEGHQGTGDAIDRFCEAWGARITGDPVDGADLLDIDNGPSPGFLPPLLIESTMGRLGAATALVQALGIAEQLRRDTSARLGLATATAAPGLVGAVLVERS